MLSAFTILRRTPRRVGLKHGEVFLTFDDGPNLCEEVTPQLLDVLHRHSVKAGFCLVGTEIQKHPEVVQRMYLSGHLLINHTFHHTHPFRQKFSDLCEEVDLCDEEIARATGIEGYRSTHFRAPFGIVTPAVRKLIRRRRFKHVLLTHYGWDTRVGPKNFEPVVDLMVANARKRRGGQFVFHDGALCEPRGTERRWSHSSLNRSWIPQAVDRLIHELKSDGLRFVLPESSLDQHAGEDSDRAGIAA